MKMIDPNLAAGLTVLGIAAAFAIPALGYGMGSGLRLGAGVFPLVVSLLLTAVGAALVVAALRSPDRGEARVPVLPFDLRAMVCVFGGAGVRGLDPAPLRNRRRGTRSDPDLEPRVEGDQLARRRTDPVPA